MTTRPRLYTGEKRAGVLAVVLFSVLAAVFLTASFEDPVGIEGAITASIGYAMFNLPGGDVPSEGFLVAFITIAIVLDAALDGALMLAFRDDEGEY